MKVGEGGPLNREPRMTEILIVVGSVWAVSIVAVIGHVAWAFNRAPLCNEYGDEDGE